MSYARGAPGELVRLPHCGGEAERRGEPAERRQRESLRISGKSSEKSKTSSEGEIDRMSEKTGHFGGIKQASAKQLDFPSLSMKKRQSVAHLKEMHQGLVQKVTETADTRMQAALTKHRKSAKKQADAARAEADEEQGGIEVQGDALYIVRRNADIVDVYNWREGILSRSFGRGRVRYDRPGGISVRGKTMYVSERHQIQVIRLPDDDSAEPEILQVIPSPDGEELGGLCLNGNLLWCMGPYFGPAGSSVGEDSTYVHLLGPCYE